MSPKKKKTEIILEPEKKAHAILTGLRVSPRKVNLLLKMVRGLPVSKALNALQFSQKAAAVSVYKLLMSAISNAENNYGYDIDRLYVSEAIVGKGDVMKRVSARAKGRAARLLKVFSQVRIVVCEIKV